MYIQYVHEQWIWMPILSLGPICISHGVNRTLNSRLLCAGQVKPIPISHSVTPCKQRPSIKSHVLWISHSLGKRDFYRLIFWLIKIKFVRISFFPIQFALRILFQWFRRQWLDNHEFIDLRFMFNSNGIKDLQSTLRVTGSHLSWDIRIPRKFEQTAYMALPTDHIIE